MRADLQQFTLGSLTVEEKGDRLPALADALEPRKRDAGRVPVPFLRARFRTIPIEEVFP
jgi:hypothetical protein